ncbi:DUF2256 domain-containing protein [Candidatus Marinimicrobia bacterium]|nr:DUF2256 domain-containing protein [Candidatus Neomarinimicrobiota bacterium]
MKKARPYSGSGPRKDLDPYCRQYWSNTWENVQYCSERCKRSLKEL